MTNVFKFGKNTEYIETQVFFLKKRFNIEELSNEQF